MAEQLDMTSGDYELALSKRVQAVLPRTSDPLRREVLAHGLHRRVGI